MWIPVNLNVSRLLVCPRAVLRAIPPYLASIPRNTRANPGSAYTSSLCSAAPLPKIELAGTGSCEGRASSRGAVPACGLHRNQYGYRQPGREPRRDREGSDETGRQRRVNSLGTRDPTAPALLVTAGSGQQTDRALEPHVGCMLWGGWELKWKFLINEEA